MVNDDAGGRVDRARTPVRGVAVHQRLYLSARARRKESRGDSEADAEALGLACTRTTLARAATQSTSAAQIT
jgi:hypothetical protein